MGISSSVCCKHIETNVVIYNCEVLDIVVTYYVSTAIAITKLSLKVPFFWFCSKFKKLSFDHILFNVPSVLIHEMRKTISFFSLHSKVKKII